MMEDPLEHFFDEMSVSIENSTFKLKDLFSASMLGVLSVWETNSAEKFLLLAYQYMDRYIEEEFYSRPIETAEIIKVTITRFNKLSYWIEKKESAINMKVLVSLLSDYCPGLHVDNLLTNEEIESNNLDKRLMKNAPTNKDKIKALKELCPELMKRLTNEDKETQQTVIHLITGVNKEDSYKYSFGSRWREADERDVKGLALLKQRLLA